MMNCKKNRLKQFNFVVKKFMASNFLFDSKNDHEHNNIKIRLDRY